MSNDDIVMGLIREQWEITKKISKLNQKIMPGTWRNNFGFNIDGINNEIRNLEVRSKEIDRQIDRYK